MELWWWSWFDAEKWLELGLVDSGGDWEREGTLLGLVFHFLAFFDSLFFCLLCYDFEGYEYGYLKRRKFLTDMTRISKKNFNLTSFY